MSDALDERTITRREMINLLKERLRTGEIKAMEMRLLDDLLTQEVEEPAEPGTLPDATKEDLPFLGENLIVGDFNKLKGEHDAAEGK